MQIKILTLLLFVHRTLQLLSVDDVSFLVDETMQNFREEIFESQSESMMMVEDSFFEFYNALNSTLNIKVMQPYIKLSKEINQSCINFPFFNLEAFAARRLMSICEEIQRMPRRVSLISEKILSNFLPDPKSLTASTLIGLMAEDFFASSHRHLDFIVPIYNQNVTCVLPLLNNFITIRKNTVATMNKLNLLMIKKLPKALRKDLKFIENSIIKLFGISHTLRNCSDESVIDTFGCISEVIVYDCFKIKSGCGLVFKSIHLTLSHLNKITALHQFYEGLLNEIDKFIEEADNVLLTWSKHVDKCVTD